MIPVRGRGALPNASEKNGLRDAALEWRRREERRRYALRAAAATQGSGVRSDGAEDIGESVLRRGLVVTARCSAAAAKRLLTTSGRNAPPRRPPRP